MSKYESIQFSKENKTNLIMNTIKFINDTFCPLGMKPIEDLPEATPCDGNSCVIAKVITDNFPDFNNVQVGITGIELNPGAKDGLINENLGEFLDYPEDDSLWCRGEHIDVPKEVGEFIYGFDHGHFPQLVDEEKTIDKLGGYEAVHTFGIDKEHCDCPECDPTVDRRYGYNGY